MASAKLTKKEKAEFQKMLKAETKAAKAILAANKGNKKAKSAAKKASSKATKERKNKRPKRGFKLSTKTKALIGKKSKAHWKSITGKGTPKSHIPLKQLEKNHARLGRTIELRKKSPKTWA